jgi:prepilin-type processing-associated H-X9-DG protein
LIVLVVVLVVITARRGSSGLITTLAVLAIMAILGAMLLPALGKAKSKAQRISSVNNLKQIGLAARIFAADNDNRLPVSFEEMMAELNTDKITYDVETGQRYTYLGAGYRDDEITPDSVIAYSPMSQGRCNVLFADGSVQIINQREFSEYSQRGFIVRIPPNNWRARSRNRPFDRGSLPANPRLKGPRHNQQLILWRSE